jgi:hypothetical protein
VSKEQAPAAVQEKMTLERARKLLRGRLRFADPTLIAAKHYILDLGAARVRLMACPWCQGVGRVLHRGEPTRKLCICVAEESPELLRDLGV